MMNNPSIQPLACAPLSLHTWFALPNLKLAAICLFLVFRLVSNGMAADVKVNLSPIETEVYGRVVLSITIANAAKYKEPAPPEIDGCDVQFSGQSIQSSTVRGATGRAQSRQSVTLQYSIVPHRPGTFEVPAMTLEVDGQQVTTEAQRFVVGQRELVDAGDLLFVEIEGEKDRVYVGQPLELTLKIWIKPYEDRGQNIRLSEGSMWKSLAAEATWGCFADRLRELAQSRQRPGGREVLRDNGQGKESSYFLYEINATIYPKRPGTIDSQDVQIIVNYPTEFVRAPDLVGDFFGSSPWAPFSPSPQHRLNSVRVIAANATPFKIEVLPIPTQGRPADYRGAVGSYRIVTQATPTKVAAGDPITLNIGIAGKGPMELLQAPPLTDLVELTRDFKVDDQPLAGFVQDEAKVFSTAIRPRRAGILQIPPIAFSYFDPETEKFETVRSDPIPISVEESEMLALDAIIGKTSRDQSQSNSPIEVASKQLEPNFSNNHNAEVLLSPAAVSDNRWWWTWIVGPPFLWIGLILVRNLGTMVGWCSSFKPAHRQCLQAIRRAQQPSQITTALVRYLGRRMKGACVNPVSAVGLLRAAGLYPLANEFETHFEICKSFQLDQCDLETQAGLRARAGELVAALEGTLASQGRFRVRGAAKANQVAQRMSLLLLAILIGTTGQRGRANEQDSMATIALTEPGETRNASLNLTATQQQVILKEAGDVYARALELKSSDSAEASELLSIAAEKYRLLIASGINNGLVWMNLGNAYLQSGRLGHAIACYERARKWIPNNRQLSINLQFANQQVAGTKTSEPVTGAVSPSAGRSAAWLNKVELQLRQWNAAIVNRIGPSTVSTSLAVASLLFWTVLIVRAAGVRFPAGRVSLPPLLLLVVAGSSMFLTHSQTKVKQGILVVNSVTLYRGEGQEHPQVRTLDSSDGQRVEILTSRNGWTQVKLAGGQVGWLPDSNVETI